jgi:hypothetical protein
MCGRSCGEARRSEATRSAFAATDASLFKRASVTGPRIQRLRSEESTPNAVLALDADQPVSAAAGDVMKGNRRHRERFPQTNAAHERPLGVRSIRAKIREPAVVGQWRQGVYGDLVIATHATMPSPKPRDLALRQRQPVVHAQELAKARRYQPRPQRVFHMRLCDSDVIRGRVNDNAPVVLRRPSQPWAQSVGYSARQ